MREELSSQIIELLGWKIPSNDIFDEFRRSKRLILVISHTSYWDFILILLYKQRFRELRENMYTVMKPQPFKTWGFLLRPLGFIPATRSEERGEGFVKRTAKKFHNKEFRLIISPEGKLMAEKWRSGYYHLCHELKADIMVAGIDYERKTLYFGPLYKYDKIEHKSLPELESILQTDMGQIVPLHLDCSYTPVLRAYDESKISAIDPTLVIIIFITLIILIIIIYLVWRKYKKEPGLKKLV